MMPDWWEDEDAEVIVYGVLILLVSLWVVLAGTM